MLSKPVRSEALAVEAVCVDFEALRGVWPKTELTHPEYVCQVIDVVLVEATRARASDVHFVPHQDVMVILWRIDGVLQRVVTLPKSFAPKAAARLKVLADLLTYRTDVPQEGRLKRETQDIEMRLSTFPTLYGEKGVVRIFSGSGRYLYPPELGLPADVEAVLLTLLGETSGAILITGPAGSGKTTTAYACLRELHRQSGAGKSLVSLEDPIESVLPGVSQSQVNRPAGFDYAMGIRSLLRQDPDVILVGEIRDRETAETVFQACLTGHLVLSTFHAGSAAEAISRLGDMGIEPYLLRTGLRGILCQRLFRSLCECAQWTDDVEARLGYDVSRVKLPVGCDACGQTGYRGRIVLAELLDPDERDIGRGVIERTTAADLHRLALKAGMKSMRQRATEAISAGVLSPLECRRVLGTKRWE